MGEFSSTSCRAATEPVDVRKIGTIEYTKAWDLQREVLTARADELGPDTMLLLEHPSVYTAGKRTEPRTARPTAPR